MHDYYLFVLTTEAMVRGYPVYQTVWEENIGEVLPCLREPGNQHDPHSVAVKKDDIIVGYLPRKISCLCSIFIRRGGSIECTATDSRRYLADLAQGGMEILCQLSFKTKGILESEKIQKLSNDTLRMAKETTFGKH